MAAPGPESTIEMIKSDGAQRDMVCRGLMLTLHRAGHIKLSAIKPLGFKQVHRTSAEKMFNSLPAQYHYLEYTQPVGEHLKSMTANNGWY